MNLPDTSQWKEKWHMESKVFEEEFTKSKTSEDLNRINRLILTLGQTMVTLLNSPTFFDENRNTASRYSQSLVYTSFLELFRNIHQTVFLSGCSLYKSACHNIRYALEFTVQSYYIDMKYPEGDFLERIRVLHEIENKSSYRGRALVNKLNLPSTVKRDINNQYALLHKKVHATYEQFTYTAHHFMDDKYQSVYFDSNELKDICKATIKIVDFFYFLFLTRFPELEKSLMENNGFMESVEIEDMPLLFGKLLGTME